MKCWEIRGGFGLEALQPGERPEPEPGPGEVVVHMRAAALNYRDLLMVQGRYNPKLPLPRIPLSDGVGEVVAVGPGVTRVEQGQRVAGCFLQGWLSGTLTRAAARSDLGGGIDGVLCERRVFSQDGLVAIPAHLSDVEAATLPCAALTAWNALIEGDLRLGETVLVLGTGGVSIFAVQLAVLAGARVIVTSSSDAKLERVRALGAHETINYAEEPAWDKRVWELTAGRGVDHVVEVGGAGTFNRSLRAVRVGGHVAAIGVLAAPQGPPSLLSLIMKGVRVRGILVGSRDMFEALNRFVGLHRLQPVVDQVFACDEVVEALKTLQSGTHFGKLALRFPD